MKNKMKNFIDATSIYPSLLNGNDEIDHYSLYSTISFEEFYMKSLLQFLLLNNKISFEESFGDT